MERLELAVTKRSQSFTYLTVTHVAFVVVALILTLIWQVYAALVLAAPSMVILLAGLLGDRASLPTVTVGIDRPRAIEGDTITVRVTATAKGNAPLLDIEMEPDPSLQHDGSLRTLTSLAARGQCEVDFQVVVDEWGVVSLGHLTVRVRDRFGLVVQRIRYLIISTIRVHIHEESVRSLTNPDRFRRLVGSHRSEERGEGCEIADIRPYQPGDRLQSLNWRISARNDEPWITLRHPDRSTNIVLLVDAYQRFGQHQADGLRRSIRAALGIARLHLSAQDPVGLMLIGQGVRWFPPELGRLHLHRLTDAMLELSTNRWAEGSESQALVHRLIPADAIVIAVSSLADSRFSKTLTSLRGRGQSVHVIEPVTYWPAQTTARRGRVEFTPGLAWRIYSLHQQVERSKLSQAGVSVIPWEEDQPIESVMLALRMAQRARAFGAAR